MMTERQVLERLKEIRSVTNKKIEQTEEELKRIERNK